MGEPVLRNTFDDGRWDYVYTIEVPNAFSSRQLVSVFFENDVLVYITGRHGAVVRHKASGRVTVPPGRVSNSTCLARSRAGPPQVSRILSRSR